MGGHGSAGVALRLCWDSRKKDSAGNNYSAADANEQ